MKRKNILIGVLALVAVAIGLLTAIQRSNPEPQEHKLKVAASFYPLYDFARNIGGNHVAVDNLTPAGTEPHDYEPTPRTIARSHTAKVFIYNGASFEPWAEKFVATYRHTAVRATANLEIHGSDHDTNHDHHDHQDPHAWLDPVAAKQMVLAIRDGLTQADPSHKIDYQKNADQYIAKLSALDMAYKEGLASCTLDTVIASHNALGYLAERYGFNAVAIAGINPDQEPSAKQIATLSDLAKSRGVHHILFEHLVSPQLAATIAQAVGAQTLAFDPIEGLAHDDQKQGKNYLSIQYQNLTTLKTALACQ